MADSARAPSSARLSSNSSSSKVGGDSKNLGAGAMAEEGARGRPAASSTVSDAAHQAAPDPVHGRRHRPRPPPARDPQPTPLTRPANSGTLSPVPPFPRPRGPPPRSYRGSRNRDQQRGRLRKEDGGRTATRTRACAQADPTRVPDVVVMETPRPRAPGAGCSHSARSLLAQQRSGGHGSRAAGRLPRPPHSGRTLRARPAAAVIRC